MGFVAEGVSRFSRSCFSTSIMKPFCIYCGKNEGTTKDHIPPKCFFLNPCPNLQRITVPCCEICRRRDEINDATVRNILISTIEAEAHDAVQSQLAGARNRSFKFSHQLHLVLSHLTQADIYSSGGIYLGAKPAFDLNNLMMDSFLHRIVRALLHKERKCGFVESNIEWRLNPPIEICHNFANDAKTRHIGDIFSYSYAFMENNLTSSIWLLTFYGNVRFFIHIQLTTD